jgi:hypothetical protein
MYNINLLGIVTMNPPLYNEYILIKINEKLVTPMPTSHYS